MASPEIDVITLFLLLDSAEAGSLTAGAAAAGITPSAASQRITKLERRLGQPLLTRLPRGVRPTEAGELLLARAREFRLGMRAAWGDLEALRNLEQGSVRLGSFPTASASILSDALKRLRMDHPGVELTVTSALRPELIDMLLSSEIELALLWSYAWTGAAEASLSLVSLIEDETVLLVPAGSEPAAPGSALGAAPPGSSGAKTPAELASLAEEDWIVRASEHPASEALRRSCGAAGFSPRVVYEAHDYQEMQAMVAAGIGIAMAPRLALVHHRPDVAIVPFSRRSAVAGRTIYLASLARRAYTPAMFAMARALREAASLNAFGP